MSDNHKFLDEKFIKFLVSIEELKNRKNKLEFLDLHNLSQDEFNNFLSYLGELEIPLKVMNDYIYPLAEKPQWNFRFNLSEWLALMSMLSHKQFGQDFLSRYMQSKFQLHFSEQSNQWIQKNGDKLIHLAQDISPVDLPFLIHLKNAMLEKKVVSLATIHKMEPDEFFLHRLIYLESKLGFVAEKAKDSSLQFQALDQILDYKIESFHYEAKHTSYDVDDFIGHVRTINGNQDRLVLKVYAIEEGDLDFTHHHLEHPFMTVNQEGDSIWAATVEICPELFADLYKLKDKIEVLDPGYVRLEFSVFCQKMKLKKSA